LYTDFHIENLDFTVYIRNVCVLENVQRILLKLAAHMSIK